MVDPQVAVVPNAVSKNERTIDGLGQRRAGYGGFHGKGGWLKRLWMLARVTGHRPRRQ